MYLIQLNIFGAQGRNRTTDTVIFSHVLYQLSYLGSRGMPGPGLAKRRCYSCLLYTSDAADE